MRGLSQGGIARALIWVVGGFVVAFGLMVLVSPELLRADFGFLTRLLGLVSIAVVPGLLVLGYAAVRRRSLDDREDDEQDPPRQHPVDPEQTP